MASSSTTALDEGILKLVFLQEAATGRKAVVPLVEGVDWDGFLRRVRTRLGLPEGHAVQLHDPGHEAVDSIDKLLEIDESTTLRISFLAAAAAQMPAASSAAATPATRRAARTSVIPGDAGGGATTDACRVEMPSSPGVLGPYEDGDGELKYKKRRITARRLASLKMWFGALLLVGVVGLAMLRIVVAG
mmetsp:Transcript_1218/g.3750  ORF Transcript_1218/g.3750 Transcript_1218/m.3750 type:complete len:189 (-) Transcript_1218:327-893(-)